MAPTLKIILGSASPGRRELMTRLSLDFSCLSPDADERAVGGASAREMALNRAHLKADALVRVVLEPALIVTADQVVECAGQVRNKPGTVDECRRFLQSYSSGEGARTVTAVVVQNTVTGVRRDGVDTAEQWFLPMPDAVIEELVQDPRLLACAGGFRIEDERLSPFLGERSGTADSIIGLPLELTERLMREAKEDPAGAS